MAACLFGSACCWSISRQCQGNVSHAMQVICFDICICQLGVDLRLTAYTFDVSGILVMLQPLCMNKISNCTNYETRHYILTAEGPPSCTLILLLCQWLVLIYRLVQDGQHACWVI